jgi:hypothetical protein
MDSRFRIRVFLKSRFSGLFRGQIKTPIFCALANRIGGLIVSWRTIWGVEHPDTGRKRKKRTIRKVQKKRGIFTFKASESKKLIFYRVSIMTLTEMTGNPVRDFLFVRNVLLEMPGHNPI